MHSQVEAACGSCGFGKRRSDRKKSRKSFKKSHKKSGRKMKSRRMKSRSHRVKSRRMKSHKVMKHSFGKINSAYSFMGNSAPASMSTFQSYTGMSPSQMATHMENIPKSLQSNFITEYGS